MSRRYLTLASAAAATIALAACSSSGSAHHSASVTHRAVTDIRQTSKACAALPAFDHAVLTYPGAGDTKPTAAQLRAWAARTKPTMQTLAANVPSSLRSDVTTVQAMLNRTAAGQPVDPNRAQSAALASFDRWGHGACGFSRLDVTNTGRQFSGVPIRVPAGPVSVSLVNRAPAGKAGFVLLIGRVRPGVRYSLQDIRENKTGLDQISQIVVAADAADGSAYATVQLAPGDYVVASPLGTPPRFAGILASKFHVS
jgi:hypothetical protein